MLIVDNFILVYLVFENKGYMCIIFENLICNKVNSSNLVIIKEIIVIFY